MDDQTHTATTDTYVPCEACELEVPRRLAVVEPQCGGYLCRGCVRVLRDMPADQERSATLQRFRDSGHCCPKCESEDIKFFFHDGEGWNSRYSCAAVALLNTLFPGEHIDLRCRRCGFSWAMQTAEQTYAGNGRSIPINQENP